MTDHTYQQLTCQIAKLQQLTDCITRVQAEFLLDDNRRHAFDTLLRDILALTDSKYGFIGEVLTDAQQKPYLKTFAITNIAWDQATRDFYEQQAPQGLEFRNLNTLFGVTLSTGQQVIANDPANHPAKAGIPEGHPPLNAYLGIPVFFDHSLVAMIGLANKALGYTEQDVTFLRPIISTVGQLVHASRLRQSELHTRQQLNNIVEASQLGTWSLDLTTDVLEVNDRWLNMLGFAVHEIEPVSVGWMRQRIHPEDLILSRTSLLNHIEGQQPFYESQFRIKHKKGHWVWIQARGRLLDIAEVESKSHVKKLYGINMDITNQKNLQHNLLQLAEHVPGLVYQFKKSADGHLTFPFAGAAALRLLGFAPEQLANDGSLVFRNVHPEDLKLVTQSIATSGEHLKIWKHRFRLSTDGINYRWLSGQSLPEILDNGEVIWHGYIQDVTEEVELQMALKQAKDLAELSVATKSSFLANMSHEIRTPMNGVIGMLDLMADNNTDTSQIESINLMRDSAYSLLTIIDDILDFSKLEAGKFQLAPVNIRLGLILDRLFSMLDFLAIKSDIELTYWIAPDIDILVSVDPVRLRQILVNLLSNAIKFCSKLPRRGEVSLNVTLQQRQGTQGIVLFSVKDNGIGIDPDIVDSLFNPFTQADPSTSRKYGGTGLGLAITQQLVKLMGGSIKAMSQPGVGTLFKVTLPLLLVEKKPVASADLLGKSIAILGAPDSNVLNGLGCYLEASGALVNWPRYGEDMQQVMLNHPTINLWIIDLPKYAEQIDSTLSTIKAMRKSRVRFLLLGRGKRRKPRRVSTHTVHIDVDVLQRQQFIDAVKAALFDEELTELSVMLAEQKRYTDNNLSILVLEDNTTNQKVIKQQLERLGYKVDVVASGRLGLQYLQTNHYNLILSDLHMPDMDGYEFVKAFRANEHNKQAAKTPVIALTANIVQEELDRCKQAGMDDYLVKPLPMSVLKDKLEQWLTVQTFCKTSSNPPALSAATERNAQHSSALFNLSSLTEMVGEDAILDVINDYVLSLKTGLAKINLAVTQQDFFTIASESHKLKSSSRMVGAIMLGETLDLIEAMLKHATTTDTLPVEHIAKLNVYGDALLNQLTAYIADKHIKH